MTTSVHDSPGTSTPCQSDIVPSSTDRGSAAKRLTRSATESPRCCTSRGMRGLPLRTPAVATPVAVPDGDASNHTRRWSAARATPRHDDSSTSERPPAASTSWASSSRASSGTPSRPGGGRCRAT